MEGILKIVCKLWGNCVLFDVFFLDLIIIFIGMDVILWRGEIFLNFLVFIELKV